MQAVTRNRTAGNVSMFSRRSTIPPAGQISNRSKYHVRYDGALQVRRTELAGFDQSAFQARRLRTANIGFDIIANHDNLCGGKPQFFDRRLEEGSRRFAKYQSFASTCMF